MFGRRYRRRLRHMDEDVLFPQIRFMQSSELVGDRAIAKHLVYDSAWRYVEEWREECPKEFVLYQKMLLGELK